MDQVDDEERGVPVDCDDKTLDKEVRDNTMASRRWRIVSAIDGHGSE